MASKKPFVVFFESLALFIFVFTLTLQIQDAVMSEPRHSSQPYAGSVWIGETGGITELSTSLGAVLSRIRDIENIRAVAVDGANAKVWGYGNSVLYAYGFDGAPILRVSIQPAGHDDDDGGRSIISVDPVGGRLFLGAGRSLFRIDGEGRIEWSLTLSHPVRGITQDSLQTRLWVATKKGVFAYDETGVQISEIEIEGHERVRDCVFDASTNRLFVALKDSLRSYGPDGGLIWERHCEDIERIDTDGKGFVWMAAARSLARADSAGKIRFFNRSLVKSGLDTPIDLAADPADGSVWVIDKKNLAHVNFEGNLLNTGNRRPGSRGRLWAICVYRDTTPPSIHIASPKDGSFINTPSPPINLSYSDSGSGVDPSTLQIKANGRDIRASCTVEATGAVCTMTGSLPEGANTLSATVIDYEGNLSEASKVEFSVDSIPPAITILSPQEGLITNEQAQTLKGRLSEEARLTLNGEPVTPDGNREFSQAILLKKGQNTLTLEATDRAGNSARAILSLTLDTEPPSITIDSPKDGLYTNKPAQSISGRVSEPATLIFEGKSSTVDPDGAFSFDWMLKEGANKLLFSAVDKAGNTGELAVTVTLDTIPPAAPDTALISVGKPVEGEVLVSGAPASVEPEAQVLTINPKSSEKAVYQANADGSFTARLAAQSGDIISIAASDRAGNASPEATMTVPNSLPPPAEKLPDASFGAAYRDIVPPDASLAAYDSSRFSLITGSVNDAGGSPLPGVSISILSHPEYGSALTDAKGRFTLPVEGGGRLTAVYKKEGLISSHRQVTVSWNEIAVIEAVTMIGRDSASTTVAFDGNPETVVTHTSTQVSDSFGARSCTLVFSGDNQAQSVDSAGNVIGTLPTITTRATEYPTPESMPAKLPPNSAFTYCAALEVDEAQRVRFQKPVVVYIDNFLGFPVGEPVPVGYYDRDRGIWVPSESGRIVRLLDTNGDGRVDALDATGSGTATDLNGDGSFEDEVKGLGDPAKYRPGATYWRFEASHFTAWDPNWNFGPPDGAQPPDSNPNTDQPQPGPRECKTQNASFVEERGRIFHEDIPLPGTSLTLHYASNRVNGYRHRISIPASGETIPQSLKGIIVQAEVAGRKFEKRFPPLPNQQTEFIWDGLDHLGKPVAGKALVHIRIGYTYDGVYQSTNRFGEYGKGTIFAGGGGGGGSITFNTGERTRQEVTLWQSQERLIDLNRKGDMGEGWTLSNHHFLNPLDQATLYKGDGTTVKSSSSIITAAAGYGAEGPSCSGSGTPANSYGLYLAWVSGTAFDAEGNFYFPNGAGYIGTVGKMDRCGRITTVAGGAGNVYSGDGGPAIKARLNQPTSVALDSAGNLYIVERSDHRVRKVDTRGVISTVAGKGTYGYSGDGGPAVDAELNAPLCVVVDAAGNLYIADTSNDRIRKVDTTGTITTVAGGGHGGDGGPAANADLFSPVGMAFDGAGNLYFADSGNRRIRKIDTSGIISTIAGNGAFPLYNGDGRPAVDAPLYAPTSVAVDAAGNVYIADTNYCRIFRVDTSGTLTIVAGSVEGESSGDGGPAFKASTPYPSSLSLDAHGDLYFTEQWPHRIRKITSPGSFKTGEGLFVAEENGKGHVMSQTGMHQKTVDLNTGRTLQTFGYDRNNLLISTTDRFNNPTEIERDANGKPAAIISPDGIRTELTVDGANKLVRIAYPDGSRYDFEYASGGLLRFKTEPNGNRFEHRFDEQAGTLTDVLDEEGGNWHYERSAQPNGDVLYTSTSGEGNETSYLDHTDPSGAYRSTITGATGAKTLFTESAGGLISTISLPCGMTLDSTYGLDSRYKFRYLQQMTQKTPSGLTRTTLRERTYKDTNSDKLPDRITDKVTVNGKTKTLLTDTLQSKKIITTPAGRSMTATYDPSTLLTTGTTMPGLYETKFGYDPKGRLTSIRTDTRQATITYDSRGNVSSVTDPENHTSTYSYDAVGRVTGIVRPDSSSLGFSYDPNGNMTVLENPLKIDHTFGYNRVNLNSSYNTPLSGSYTYNYDRDRRLTEMHFPSGKKIRNIYDKKRLVRTETPEGNIDLTYLCGDKVGSITNGAKTITYTYDGSLPTSETLAGTLNQTLGYDYNNDFMLTRSTYAGASVDYAYDSDNFLTKAGAFTISRNSANGLPESVSDGTLNLTRTFNGFGELSAQTFTVNDTDRYSWVLSRDKAGKIVAKTETMDGVTTQYAYSYDTAGRLLTVKRDDALVEEYHYSPNGTRTNETNRLRGIASRAMTYSEEDHLFTAGDTTYGYDPDGFLISKTHGSNITRYAYSSRGELQKVELPDGRINEYEYDPLGRRIAKKIDGSVVQKYLWQDTTRLLAIFDGNDSLSARFLYADDRMPIAMIRGETTYYLVCDQVGSLKMVMDTSGKVVKQIEYDAIGNIVSDSNSSLEVPFGFAGGLTDSETGLVHFGFRDYDPDIGRWSAKDPILFRSGDSDVYAYVQNDPINRTDPFGLKTFMCTAPLHVLGGKGKKSGPNIWGNPFYHQYICVNSTCGGQDRAGDGPWYQPWSNGKPSNDTYNDNSCEEKAPDDPCLEQCLIDKFAEPRPRYSIGPLGTDCQEWADDTFRECQKQCK